MTKKTQDKMVHSSDEAKAPVKKKSTVSLSEPELKPAEEVASSQDVTNSNSTLFPIVGIGASAGGLDAFKTFLQAMPPDSGMAFVLVQHLDPTHESMMTDLLTKYTSMPVLEIKDDMPLTPNTVYMIPPNKYLFIKEGYLHLTEPVVRRGMRMPIDFLFRSMAENLQERAICIVLSGTGADGTLGVRAVKGEGGTALVQDPTLAQYDGMPQNAIATGIVDFILPIEEMPKALLSYVQHSHSWGTIEAKDLPLVKTDDFQSILAILQTRTNHDFRCYKKGTLSRRIHRRMSLRQVDNYAHYLKLLRADPSEVKALLKDLLIGVTSFFRDPDAWIELEKQVLTKLLASKNSNDTLRIWVAGCSSGEEAYSLAILIAEIQGRLNNACTIQMFASDIDEDALETARNAVYPESIAADVSTERLQRYFFYESGHYRVIKSVRDMVVFANQNLVRDPPFSKLDLISCRNLLIYLDSMIQKQVMNLMHFALKESGYVFLGPSESVSHQVDLFETVSKKWRIYRRIGVNQHYLVEFPSLGVRDERRSQLAGHVLPREPRIGSITALAHEILLREYVPAAALVNRRGEAIYFHGSIFEYLQVVAGEPTRDIAEMARDGLSVKIRSALQRSIRANKPISLVARIRSENESTLINIKARPLDEPSSAEGLILITFEEIADNEPAWVQVENEPIPEEIRQLEYELTATREDLQSTIEELETSNEELKASNEEVMSMNEELQSTNEELETSKEELQSLNEELTTVNNQLQDKVHDLEGANNDMANLLNSTHIATLFLDKGLRVRRFTPSAVRLIRLIPGDVGRNLEDINLRFQCDDLLDQVREVLDSLHPKEKTIVNEDNGEFLCRILPYRTADDHIDGVVLTFVDITELKRMEAMLSASEERFRCFMDNSPAISWIKDSDGRYVYLSQSYEQRFNIKLSDWHGKTDEQVWPSEIAKQFRQNDLAVLDNGQALTIEEKTQDSKGQIAYWQNVKFLFHDVAGQSFIGGIGIDISRRKLTEQQLKLSEARLASLVDATSDAIYIKDQEGRYLLVNKATTVFVGKTETEILGQDDFALFPKAEAEALKTRDQQILSSGQVQTLEELVTTADGQIRTFLSIKGPVRSSEGRCFGLFGISRDITEQKKNQIALAESQERLSLTMDAVNDGLWDWNINTGVVFRSPRYYELVHKDPKDDAHDFAFFQSTIHPDDVDRVVALIDAHRRGESPSLDFNYRLANSDKKMIWLRVRGRAVNRNADGTALRMVGTLSDVTDARQKELEIELAKSYAEQANASKSQFLADMAHEIRTPLHAILGFTEILEKKVKDADLHTNVEHIASAGQHLLAIINDILDFSKIEANQIRLESVDINLQRLVCDLHDLFEKPLQKKGLYWVEDIDPQLADLNLKGDELRLRQILINLLSNAIKFTDEGQICLRVRLQSSIDQAHQCYFSIEDTGSGIADNKHNLIFNAFEQTDASVARQYGGTGLGLAICKKLVEKMDGRIGVSSQVGEGSQFWFTVMLHSTLKSTLETQTAVKDDDNLNDLMSRYTDTKILIADDYDFNRELIRSQLEEYGIYHLDEAENGFDAVQKALKTSYDLILMDIQMPNMTGLEATQQIRKIPEYAQVPIIAFTANGQIEANQACFDAGMNDLLAKPSSAEVLCQLIIKWLGT